MRKPGLFFACALTHLFAYAGAPTYMVTTVGPTPPYTLSAALAANDKGDFSMRMVDGTTDGQAWPLWVAGQGVVSIGAPPGVEVQFLQPRFGLCSFAFSSPSTLDSHAPIFNGRLGNSGRRRECARPVS